MNKVYEIVTEEIIKRLEAGTIPWKKPWAAVGNDRNLVSGREYSGINVFLLSSLGFTSNNWLTFNQCRKLGGNVKKGARGTIVVFWKLLESKTEKEENKKIPILRYYRVFNATQCEGIEEPKLDAPLEHFNEIEAAEDIVIRFDDKPKITHSGGRAFYRPAFDDVTMPERRFFKSEGEYYSTVFHELGHSTGHKKRLNRDTLQAPAYFGSHEYSKEELVAEFTSAFLCKKSGIDNTQKNSAGYIQGWLKRLRDDKTLLVAAAGHAARAASYILGEKKAATA